MSSVHLNTKGQSRQVPQKKSRGISKIQTDMQGGFKAEVKGRVGPITKGQSELRSAKADAVNRSNSDLVLKLRRKDSFKLNAQCRQSGVSAPL